MTTDHLLMVRPQVRRSGSHSSSDCHHVQDQQALHPRREADPGPPRQGGEGGGRAGGEARGLLPAIRSR